MRETIFRHKQGGIVDLPLLVPSFTSKGFGYFKKNGMTYSETSSALDEFGRYLNESYLLSTFDVFHGHFMEPEQHYGDTSLILLDSGGYELNPEFDSTEPKMTPVRQLDFTAEDYENTLVKLYQEYGDKPFVIANYDWGTKNCSFEEQIKAARELFIKFPNWSNNFIIKPHKSGGVKVQVKDLVPYIKKLSCFDIIGVTEKELGKNLKDRLTSISQLRSELDNEGIKSPIHIWGGLDPLITPLYFFAGADIFDGVSWLRYLYFEGKAVNRESYTVLKGNLSILHDHAVMLSINDNLLSLQGLATSLRAFANSDHPDFDMFDGNGEFLKRMYKEMKTIIPGMKG